MRVHGFLGAAVVAFGALVPIVPLAPAPATAAPVPSARRNPVIIVEGTAAIGLHLPLPPGAVLGARLRADGYQVFDFHLPGGGLGPYAATAMAFPPFVDDVLARTGATRVDLIGHSQGGLVGRYYIKFLGGAGRVGRMISLGVPHYGSTLADLTLLGGLDCLGICSDSATGSAFLAALNGSDDTFGDVRYTNLATALDELVVPYTNAFLHSPDAVNVAIQDRCPLRIVEHITLIVDGTTYTGIRSALADRPVTLDCLAL